MSVCKNGLLTCNPKYEPFPTVRTLGNILLGKKHEGSLAANDLVVLWVFFLILLYFDENFKISSPFIG
jgi:hypothetical protein